MNRKLFLLFSILIGSFSQLIKPYIYAVDYLKDAKKTEVYFFSDRHVSNAMILNPELYKKLYGSPANAMEKRLYTGINQTQSLSTIKAIKDNFNISESFLTIEQACKEWSHYGDLISFRNCLSRDAISLNLISYLSKFEKFPNTQDIDFRIFMSELEGISTWEAKFKILLKFEPSRISGIVFKLIIVLNELRNSPSSLIRNEVNRYFYPKFKKLLFDRKDEFYNNSLLYLLEKIDMKELSEVCNELIEFITLDRIISNPGKKHFVFMGGSHCLKLKLYLEVFFDFTWNEEKSYRQVDHSPMNMKKYFDTILKSKSAAKVIASKL